VSKRSQIRDNKENVKHRQALPASGLVTAFALVLGCTPNTTVQQKFVSGEVTKAASVPALPTATAVNSDQFAGAGTCARCHSASATVMRDGQGRDVSQLAEWSVSMMALSARDPYFLAALNREIRAQPSRGPEISTFCFGCHAPMAAAVADAQNAPLTIRDMLLSDSLSARFAREGVTCVACHSQSPVELGAPDALGKPPVLARGRLVYGSLTSPLADPMKQMIQVDVQYGAHIADSTLCAGCHTVLVPVAGAAASQSVKYIVEQGTFLEWQASGFSAQHSNAKPNAKPALAPTGCIGCHMQTVDDDGVAIHSAYSTRPLDAPVRPSFARHTLTGGSAYLLGRLAQFSTWLAAGVTGEQLQAASMRSTKWLQRAARLQITHEGSQATITVENLTGHKLPTGFSSRRMWLKVVVRDRSGRLLLLSGDHRNGRIIGETASITSHQTEISLAQATPQIWQSVPIDPTGTPTHLLMNVAAWGKDNRILPKGWQISRAAAEITPVGVDGDVDFLAGQDQVVVRLPAGAANIEVQLLFQAIPPDAVASYDPDHDGIVAQFLRIVATPEQPTVMAEQALSW
jgi:cytochrome c553